VSFRKLVLLVVLVGVAAMAVRPSFDTDTWWHLRAAQWIVDNGALPISDPFSSTMRGSPWAYPGWLAQLALLASFRLGGLTGLTLFSAILVGVALAFLWPLLEGPLLLRAGVLLLSAATSAIYWAARPHIVSFALAAYFLWALEMWRRGSRPRFVWTLPLATALWVNVHGGFAIGFILLLMYLAGVIFDGVADALRHRGTWAAAWEARRRSLATLAAVIGLCLAAGALNPHGPAILAYPFKTVSIPILQTYIQEWQPPDLQSPQLMPFLAMLLLLIVVLGLSRLPGQSAELITATGWTALALLAVRNIPVFALVAALPIARHAAGALPTPEAGAGTNLKRKERRWLNAALGSVLLLALLFWIGAQTSGQRNRAHLESQVPVGAVAALRDIRPRGHLLNDYDWGGYVLWELYPDYASFVDGRTDVFAPEVLEDYIRLWTAGPGWEAAMERWDIGTVLLPPGSPLVAELVRLGWDELFRDSRAVVLLRPEPG
jgi:hypothetical protein